jgi:hypothetical protein
VPVLRRLPPVQAALQALEQAMEEAADGHAAGSSVTGLSGACLSPRPPLSAGASGATPLA